MFRLIFLPVRLVRLGVRLAGVKGSLLLLVGIGVGLLVAPTTGAQMRARLMERLEGGPVDPERIPAEDLSL
ncbi:MAG TPA: YtxH domain-containing protein [Acidimicrobiales bacterium]